MHDKRGTKQIVAATFSLGIGSSVFGDRNGSSQTSAVKGPHSVKDNGRAKQNVGATSSSRNTEVQQGSSTQQLMTEVNDINRVNVVCTEPDGTNFSKKQRKVWTLDREYGISHNVLEQHFGKKLEDVADILGVSRSTLKQICRKHHIFRWPSSRAKKFKCFLTRQEFVHTTEENVKKPQRNQLLCNLPLEKYSLSSAQTRSNAARVLNDSSSIMVKATHRGGIIRFLLSVSSRRSDLEEEVSTRLRLSVGSFKIKYLDEDDDWVLITCDADLRTCMSTLGSVGKTKINILVDQM